MGFVHLRECLLLENVSEEVGMSVKYYKIDFYCDQEALLRVVTWDGVGWKGGSSKCIM